MLLEKKLSVQERTAGVEKIKFKGNQNLDKYMKLYEQIHYKIN